MKKLLFVLFFSLVCSAIQAQVKANNPSATYYANGDSYGFYIDEIPGAVSYEWSVTGDSGAVIWPGWDTAIDITFGDEGYCQIFCTVTLSNGSVQVHELEVIVYEE